MRMRLGTLVEDLKTYKRTLAFSLFPFAYKGRDKIIVWFRLPDRPLLKMRY